MKKIIAVALALVLALALVGCSGGEAKVWEWAQSLDHEDIISATPWSQDKINQEDAFASLDDTQTLELITLLNKLTKDSFTHNKHLRGGTPTFGIEIVVASKTYRINQANGPHGSLEMSYNEKLWWIDNEELSAFIQELAGQKNTDGAEKEVLAGSIDYPHYNGVEELAKEADYIIHGKVIGKTCEWRVISQPATELYLNPEDVPPSEEDLVTVYTVQVLDSYLPTAQAGDAIEVLMMGGETDTTIYTFEGIPELFVDKAYVFFLSESSLFENAGWPLNPTQGICTADTETLESLQTILASPVGDGLSFSDYANEELQVYYCDWSKETDTRIRLSEAQAVELLKLLEPYGSTLTSDVLKSEFSKFYRIHFGVSMTVTIDAERGKYGDQGASYLFAMEKTPGAFIKGTYVDADLLDFLDGQLAEEGIR